MQNMKSYILSQKADADIDGIFDYTEKEFGFKQAVSYVEQFEILFNQLTKHPQLGKVRSEIKEKLLSISVGEHVVFYTILSNYIRIVRVLHGRSDLPRQFK